MKGSAQSLKRRGKMRCICAKGLFPFAGVGGSGLQTTGARWLQKWVGFEKLHKKLCPKIEKNKSERSDYGHFCVHNRCSRR